MAIPPSVTRAEVEDRGPGPLGFPAALLLPVLVTAAGGFLFGYDTAVISGAIGSIQEHFDLSPVQTGWAGGSAIVGAIPGSLAAGLLSDRFGRKRVLLLCAALFAVSSVASAMPATFGQFIAARFVGGLAIGASSMVCPVYIAELAPAKHRGRLGALFQLGIVVGIFLVFFVNLRVQRVGDAAWNVDTGWRWMLALGTVPAAVFAGLTLFVPESPRWLLVRGRSAEALPLLTRLWGPAGARLAAGESAATDGPAAEGTLAEVFAARFRRPLVIAIGLAALAQLSGINAIMYYAPEVFKATGVSSDSAFASTVWVGVVNLVFTLLAVAFVDSLGRRPLLLIGTACQTASLAAVAWLFHVGGHGAGVLAGVLVFVAAFAMAMGPIPWIVISEIFPARIRGRASSVGVFAIWVACYGVAQTFPVLQANLGPAVTFGVYGACSMASLVFVAVALPETKGRSLEQIEATWRKA